MPSRIQFAGSLQISPDGLSSGATSTVDFSDTSGGGSFMWSKTTESYQLSTSGSLGGVFQTLDTPAIVEALLLVSKNAREFCVRLNGLPAIVTGSAATFGTIANADTFTIAVDQGAAFSPIFLAGDTTVAAVCQRINAYAGAIIATQSATGQLVLSGANTGGQGAQADQIAYGSITLSGSAPVLAKLGMIASTTYGSGDDFRTDGRFYVEPPTSGAGLISKVELSGIGELLAHVAGRMS